MTRVGWRAQVTSPYWRRRFAEFGEGTVLHRPDWVYGPRHVAIGSECLFLHGLWMAVERQAWTSSEPVLRIGDRVKVRPYCTFSAAEQITVEDDVVIAAFTTVIDSDHTWADGRPNVLFNRLRTSPVRIGQGTWIGERVGILRGADIGRFCVIGSNSIVRGTIPDYSVAVGSPARVVGRTDGPGADAPGG